MDGTRLLSKPCWSKTDLACNSTRGREPGKQRINQLLSYRQAEETRANTDLTAMRLPALVIPILLLCLYSCGESLPSGAQRIVLDKRIHSSGAPTFQIHYELEDTAAWEKVMAEADTTHREGDVLKLRSNHIWYEVTIDSKGMEAQQPYPGWRLVLDTIPTHNNFVYTAGMERMMAEIPAADVLLGQDSARIGVIHLMGRAFGPPESETNYPDYLILFPPGHDSIPINLNQDNIGPISTQTVIRIGRHHYALRSLSDDRRELVIEQINDPGDVHVSAQVDLNYRQVSVNDLSGKQTSIKRKEGKELILYFTSQRPYSVDILRGLDSLYRAMPDDRREKIQVEVILQLATPASAKNYLDTLNLNWPVHLGNEKTCLRLNCRPSYPYYLSVNENGRITDFFGRWEKLIGKFGHKNTVLKK